MSHLGLITVTLLAFLARCNCEGEPNRAVREVFCAGVEEKYVGQERDGRKHGYGALYYRSGDVYEGEFRDNYKHGNGTCTFSNGRNDIVKSIGNLLRKLKCLFIRKDTLLSRNRGLRYVGEWDMDEVDMA